MHQYAEKGVPDEVVDENFDENLEQIEELFGADAPADPPPNDDEFEEIINDRRN